MNLKTLTKQELIDKVEKLKTENNVLKQEVQALSVGDIGKLMEELESVKDDLYDTKEEIEQLENERDELSQKDAKLIEELNYDFDQFVKEFKRFINGESCPNHIKELEYLTKSLDDLNNTF